MALKDPFAQECLEKMQAIGTVTARAMFGGYGFYYDGVFFAVIAEEGKLHFKADEESVGEFELVGAEQWVYDGHPGKPPTGMPYWCPPGDFLNDPAELKRWMDLGLAAGRRKAASKKPKSKLAKSKKQA